MLLLHMKKKRVRVHDYLCIRGSVTIFVLLIVKFIKMHGAGLPVRFPTYIQAMVY